MKPRSFAHLRDLFQHLVEAVGRALLAQLVLHVGEHAARHLRHQDARVDALQRALEAGVLLAHLAEVGGDLFQQVQVQPVSRGVPCRMATMDSVGEWP
jgi:hypothetical protein